MNRWALMLAECPPGLQRLIARFNRISLPRGADHATRTLCLRRALCRARVVRSSYQNLNDEERAALRALAAQGRGVTPAELEARFGPVRSWRAIAGEFGACSISERLILRGLLLPRPATHRHPTRYIVPPQVRWSLPQPVTLAGAGPAPDAALPPAIFALHMLVFAAAQHPLRVHLSGVRAPVRRLLAERLPLPPDEAEDLLRFAYPLALDLGLLAVARSRATVTPAAAPFLTAPLAEQQERLRAAWLRAARPDAWVRLPGTRLHGIDWPALRRRVLNWAQALPPGELFDPDALYPSLAAQFGALATPQTHGYRTVNRVPWRSRRSWELFGRALRGPLAWLGELAWHANFVFRPVTSLRESSASAWVYGDDGVLHVPAGQGADLLRLARYARWERTDAYAVTYRLTPRTIAAACSAGYDAAHLRTLLQEHAGTPPDAWDGLLASMPAVRIASGSVVVADEPAVLSRAVRSRSVQRALGSRLAPGVAVVEPDQVGRLTQALTRQGIAVTIDPASLQPSQRNDLTNGLMPGDAAALLVACAFYRAHAPAQAPLQVSPQLEAQLRSLMTPALRQATERALAALVAPAEPAAVAAPTERQPLPDVVQQLRRAIRRGHSVRICYDRKGEGQWSERVVRPLSLEMRYDAWSLRAFCTTRQAERTFRVDRIGTLTPLSQASTNQVVGLIDTQPADADNLGALPGALVEPVTAHAVSIGVDQRQQFALHNGKLPGIEETLEHTVLHMRTIAFEKFQNFGTPPVTHDVVTDNCEHGLTP